MNSGSVLDFGWSDTPPPPSPSPGVRTCRLTPVLCNASKLTEDDGKVHVDTGEVQLYDPLKRKNIWVFLFQC